jgi:lipoate-protein ligase A
MDVLRSISLDPPRSAAENMEADRLLYERASKAPPSAWGARVYEWSRPSISLGISQSEAILDLEACRAEGVDWVKRLTGGKAVLHHRELTYAVAGAAHGGIFGSSLYETYLRIGEALLHFFRALGLPAQMIQTRMPGAAADEVCFDLTSLYELEIDGRKIAGSAQKRGQSAFLQHGSIPVHESPVHLLKFLKTQPPSHKPMACLADFGPPPPLGVLKSLLADSMEAHFR